jgi:Tfp pilus assembly protein PilO
MVKPSLITGAIVLAFAWHVGYDHVQKSQQAIRAAQERLREAQATQQVRVAVASSLEALRQMAQRCSPEGDTEWLVNQVSQLAQADGIRLTAIAQQDPRTIQGVTVLAVTLQVDASYHQLAQFVSHLENAPVFLRVDELTLGAAAHERARTRMTVSTFYVGDAHGALAQNHT